MKILMIFTVVNARYWLIDCLAFRVTGNVLLLPQTSQKSSTTATAVFTLLRLFIVSVKN